VWAILVSQARPARPASPGVLAVFSAEHVIKAGFKSPRPILHFNERDGSVIKVPHRPALAHQRVRFVGEAVALVVGETEAGRRGADRRRLSRPADRNRGRRRTGSGGAAHPCRRAHNLAIDYEYGSRPPVEESSLRRRRYPEKTWQAPS
jgi:aerobic carbon-monoxide dehydrogenase large subunit